MKTAKIKDFAEWLNTYHQISKRSFDLYLWVIRKFFKERKELTEENVNKFLKNHPRLYYRIALKRYLEFKNLDWKIIKIKEPARKPREEPTRHDLEELLAKIKHKDVYWILRLLYYTGARISEILKLRLKDIDFNAKILTLKTKGDQYRPVKLPSNICEELKHYLIDVKGILANHKCFFTTTKNIKTAHVMLIKYINKSKTLTESEKKLLTSTHNFRRAMINWIIDKVGGIEEAKSFIGHKSILTTLKYVSKKEEERKKEKVERAIEFDAIKKSVV